MSDGEADSLCEDVNQQAGPWDQGHPPAVVHTGESGKAGANQVRGRQQKQDFIWGGKAFFSDAPAHPAPSCKGLPVV